jgi:hypothetical protein
MKVTLLTILIVFAATPSVIAQVKNAQTASNSKFEQELINLTRKWDEAIVKQDVKTLETILHDDYSIKGIPKARFVAEVSSPDPIYTSYQRKVTRVQLHKDTAVVFASNDIQGRYPASTITFFSSFGSMDVWVRERGRWRCVATWTSQIEDENKKEDEVK